MIAGRVRRLRRSLVRRSRAPHPRAYGARADHGEKARRTILVRCWPVRPGLSASRRYMARWRAMSADSVFVRACRREPVPFTPVWFMRQAGRSLPEYRAARADIPMLEACRRPDLVTELTLQPVRRHGVDAAILFSDIVVPLAAAGIDLDIKPGVGPVIAQPVATESDVAAIRPLEDGDVGFVREAVGLLIAGARRDATHRLRRCAVHARVVSGRGRSVPDPREDQGSDVRCPRPVARTVCPAR